MRTQNVPSLVILHSSEPKLPDKGHVNTMETTAEPKYVILCLEQGAEATTQPTAWIPLVDVSEQNGTLKLVRGGHRRSASHTLSSPTRVSLWQTALFTILLFSIQNRQLLAAGGPGSEPTVLQHFLENRRRGEP